jgi:cytochrome c oxidase subunit 2
MAMLIIAEAPAAFDRWRDAQLAPATAPGNDEQEAGRQVVTGKACAACHKVRGTAAFVAGAEAVLSRAPSG